MEKLGSKARARVIKWFQITDRDKILWLSEKEYMKRLNRPGYRLGWIDERHIFFGPAILLTHDQMLGLLGLDVVSAWWVDHSNPDTEPRSTGSMAPRGHDL